MNILLLKAYYNPEVAASQYLTDNLLEDFAKENIHMTLHVPSPTRGVSDEVRRQYKQKKHEVKYDGKLEVYRFRMFKEDKKPLQRFLRYISSHVIHFIKGVQEKNTDLLLITSTPPTLGALSVFVKKIKKIPMVYILQDVFPDSLVGAGLTKKNSLLWKIGRMIENFTYRNADKIIVISEDMKTNIMKKGVPESKIEVIYNWVDENKVYPVSRIDNKLFDEFKLSRNDFYVVYAGNLGHAQNIDIILDAAERLKELEDIKFLIFGSGGLEKELKEKAHVMNITNLQFLPIQPVERVPEVYGLGNVSVVSCKAGLGESAMPSKTWNIMACGTCVLANFDKDSDLQKIIENNKVGLFTIAGDIEGFTTAIKTLYEKPFLCESYGNNGRDFIIKNLSRKIGTSKYLEVIKSVKNGTNKQN